jgi:hypothetical protein
MLAAAHRLWPVATIETRAETMIEEIMETVIEKYGGQR